ncbi:MAG: cobalamin-binding protein [Proteobacteria bacterium]|nr:cobalamin-binding protein [Pseudomonadota bacterium]
MAKNEALFEAISKGNRKAVQEMVRKEIDADASVVELLNGTMIPAMRHVGERFSRNEIYVPEMLIAARAMQAGLDLISPLLEKAGHKARAKVAIGTVSGDLHDIGKNLVAMMLKGAGFEVMDIGVDCSVEKYEQAVADGAQAICLSALLTTTMPYMKVITEKLGNTDVKIIVGGAPVTSEYAQEIGAHGYGADANDAVRVLESCLGQTVA